MKSCMVALLFFPLLTVSASSQGSGQDSYWKASRIEHGNKVATVSASDPRPLWMAINALKREYGWTVDYEEPAYDLTETVPAHNPRWDTAHPERPSRVPAGTSFAAAYAEDANTAKSSLERLAVVRQVVSSYNGSPNPGSFVVTILSDGQIDVVGQPRVGRQGVGAEAAKSILDTEINLGSGPASAAKSLSALVEALSSTSGISVRIGVIPVNLLVPAQVRLPAGSAQARTILELIADSARVPMNWSLLYEWDSNCFFLSLQPQSILATDRMGNQVIHWIPKVSEQKP